MNGIAILVVCGIASLVAAFLAGLTFRDRRREREGEVIDAAICGIDERVERIERLLAITGDE